MPIALPKLPVTGSRVGKALVLGAAFLMFVAYAPPAVAGFKLVMPPSASDSSPASGSAAPSSPDQPVASRSSDAQSPVVVEQAGSSAAAPADLAPAPPASQPVPLANAPTPVSPSMQQPPVATESGVAPAPSDSGTSPMDRDGGAYMPPDEAEDMASPGPTSLAPPGGAGEVSSAPMPPPPGLAPPPASVAPGAPIVEGFGNNVPLTIALRQVLPDGYAFTLDRGVDKATTVNWIGGRPWPDVLQTMLAGAGLAVQIGDRKVVVSHSTGLSAQLPTEAPVAMSGATGRGGPQMLVPPPGVSPQAGAMPPSAADVQPVPPSPVALPSASVASAPEPPAATDATMSADSSWDASSGQSLHQVLAEWCKQSHTDLQWETEYDYPVEAEFHVNGTFESAVRRLLRGFANADPEPVGVLHRNADVGHPVLLIKTRGNNYGD